MAPKYQITDESFRSKVFEYIKHVIDSKNVNNEHEAAKISSGHPELNCLKETDGTIKLLAKEITRLKEGKLLTRKEKNTNFQYAIYDFDQNEFIEGVAKLKEMRLFERGSCTDKLTPRSFVHKIAEELGVKKTESGNFIYKTTEGSEEKKGKIVSVPAVSGLAKTFEDEYTRPTPNTNINSSLNGHRKNIFTKAIEKLFRG